MHGLGVRYRGTGQVENRYRTCLNGPSSLPDTLPGVTPLGASADDIRYLRQSCPGRGVRQIGAGFGSHLQFHEIKGELINRGSTVKLGNVEFRMLDKTDPEWEDYLIWINYKKRCNSVHLTREAAKKALDMFFQED